MTHKFIYPIDDKFQLCKIKMVKLLVDIDKGQLFYRPVRFD